MISGERAATRDVFATGTSIPEAGMGADSRQVEWYELLCKTVQAYTRGESSSLPIETAGSLLQSLHYTVSLAACGADAGTLPLCALYERGRASVDRYLTKARRLWYLVKTTLLPLDAPCHTQAIEKAGPSFFKAYDPAFFAHETPGDFDYFTSVSLHGSGATWMYAFLHALYWENLFCRRFPLGDVESTLKAHGLLGKAVPINIFEPVFQAAILSCLLEKETITLCVKPQDNRRLLFITRDQTPDEMRRALNAALVRLAGILHIQSKPFLHLLAENTQALAPRLITARESGSFCALFHEW